MSRDRGLRRRLPALVAPAILLLARLGVAQAAVPEGTPLFIPLPPSALPATLGANGFVAAGNLYSGGTFHWMPTSGVTPIGGLAVYHSTVDGRTFVGEALDPDKRVSAAVFTVGQGWQTLAGNVSPCDAFLSSARGVSDDGRIVVGLLWVGCQTVPFRWEQSTGMVPLSNVSSQSASATGVSGDGHVVVGWREDSTGFREGARWLDGSEEIFQGPSGPAGEARAANRDGSIVVGLTCQRASGLNPPAAWMWRQGAAVTCFPVTPPSWAPVRPYTGLMQALSEDGRVTGGAITFGNDAESVVWFDGEPFLLRDYLRSHGVADAFDGWINTGFVTGISPDGRTIVGYGAGPLAFQGYMVILPPLGAK